jgi:DNA helicase-2/ATP-dependent DNA helicase PcrA
VIGLADGQFPGRRSIEAGDVEEERRLFYVAVTRARNELYLSYPKIASRPGPGGMMLTPSRFLQELSPEPLPGAEDHAGDPLVGQTVGP